MSLRVYAALLVVQVLFGLWPVFGTVVMGHMSPEALIGLRTLVATPLLFVMFRPGLPPRGPNGRRPWGTLALLGLLGIAGNQLMYAEGLNRAGPINAALLTLLIPAQTLLLAWVSGRERPGSTRLVGVAIALFGALTLARTDGLALSDRALWGNLALVGNTLSYAAYLVLARPLAERMGGAAMVTWAFAFGALEALPMTAPALLDAPLGSLSAATWVAVAFIILGATVGTYALNAYALARADSSVVAVYIYVQPVVSASAAWLVLDRLPAGNTLLAGALIALGVALSIGLVDPARWIRRRGAIDPPPSGSDSP